MIPLKFSFSPKSKSTPIPTVISEEWIDKRLAELKDCFNQLNLKISSIDASTLQGKSDLKTALELSTHYINYRGQVNRAIKRFYGAEEELKLNPDKVYTKPLRQR